MTQNTFKTKCEQYDLVGVCYRGYRSCEN